MKLEDWGLSSGSNKNFAKIVRAKIAIDSVAKKDLARKCDVSRCYFSQMIHGDLEMPNVVREVLIEELKLKPIMNYFKVV